jgi:hypothetical protein
MPTRRRYLAAVGTASLAGLAGCTSVLDAGGAGTPSGAGATGAPPLADESLALGHTTAYLREQIMEGGPDKDGIPSIDDPAFEGAAEAYLDDDEPVFGVVVDGDVRAYPQSILVWHEIVNDTVGGVPVTVTYCPLTGTAMGFQRGETTFGVSGRLVNNNLVMYDRATDSRWQQVAATSIEGVHEGRSLRELPVRWTTWGAWRRAHPETRLLSTDTGYVRDYSRDPYGDYAPRSGYYERGNDHTLFAPLSDDDRLPKKAVVVGARTATGAAAFEKRALRERGVARARAGETRLVAAHAPDLDVGHVYRADGATVEGAGAGRVTVDGETYAADALPLDPVVAFDAMWFAWVGFYPDTALVAG